MSQDPPGGQRRPITLDYRGAGEVADRGRRAMMTVLKWVLGLLVLFCVVSALLIPTGHRNREQARVFKCANNLKNIAAAMIEYSNQNHGHYPDRFEDLLPSGMTSEIFCCPESNDQRVLGTLQEQMANLSSGGHLSYVYLGKGMTEFDFPLDGVLVYEPLTNHKGRGMNVLFGDYHVEFIDAKSAQAMLKLLVPGKPLIWPPRSTTKPVN